MFLTGEIQLDDLGRPKDLIDLTGDKTDDIQVEIMHAPAGHEVVYIHHAARTLLRLCRPKSVEVLDRRPVKSMNWEEWKASLEVGYYWIENIKHDEETIQRIIEVIAVGKLEEDGVWSSGYHSGNWCEGGFYISWGGELNRPEYVRDWEGFKAIRCDAPLFG
jgi:hypothetical protein